MDGTRKEDKIEKKKEKIENRRKREETRLLEVSALYLQQQTYQ